ncbi:MAG: LysE family translocator [Thermoleophilaceae bacterium]
MDALLAFLAVAVLVIVTPGPDTAVTIRGTLLGGRRAGVMTASGVVTGQACWTVAASAGVTALLVASEPAFLALKFAGAAYLVYLGVQALVTAIRGQAAPVERDAADPRRLPAAAAYRQGLISDLGNPKMAAFFTSLLPQFGATDAGPSFWLMLALGLLFCVLTWLWLVLYATAIHRLGDALRGSAVRRSIEAVTGTVLVALGLRLATERQPS